VAGGQKKKRHQLVVILTQLQLICHALQARIHRPPSVSSGFGEYAKPKTLNELIPLSTTVAQRQKGCQNGKHINSFEVINMNGRIYDPRLGRFLSPDPYVQAPDFSQSFNRYSYVWNNPMKFVDPSGEFLNLAFWGWVFFWESTANLLYGHDDPFRDAARTATEYTSAMGNVNHFQLFGNNNTYGYISFSPFNFFLPGIGVSHQEGNWTFGVEAGLSMFGWYTTASINYTNNKWSFTIGGGYGSNHWAIGGSITYDGYGPGYYYTSYGNQVGPDGNPNPQRVGGLQWNWPGGSIRLENDFLAGKIKGDTKDRWRTNSLEVAIGDLVFGSSVYTNQVNEKQGTIDLKSILWGFNWNNMESWKDGKVYSSPLWIGLRTGNVVGRFGYSHHIFQDFFQNGVHKFIVPTPYFTDYNDFKYEFYYFSGYYNPYSLW